MIDIPAQFSGIKRLFGNEGYHILKHAHFAVIGIGGVGSWTAEALARSGVGNITLIDLDDVAETNINRQIHALHSTINKEKVLVMEARIHDINPHCRVNSIEDFATAETVSQYLSSQFDMVIDAVDNVNAKAAIIAFCKRRKLPVITVGAAGGQIDPTQVKKGDLAKTIQDPLAAKLRSILRRDYNFSKNTKRNFGIECIFSTEQLRYPQSDGSVDFAKHQQQGTQKMDCSTGFGAFAPVTATFGLVAASRAIQKVITKKTINL